MVPGVVLLQVAWGRAVGKRLGELASAGRATVRVIVPDGRRRRRITCHGVTVVGTVFQRDLPILVQLLELGPPVLEPDFHLEEGRKEGKGDSCCPTATAKCRGNLRTHSRMGNRNATMSAALPLLLAGRGRASGRRQLSPKQDVALRADDELPQTFISVPVATVSPVWEGCD